MTRSNMTLVADGGRLRSVRFQPTNKDKCHPQHDSSLPISPNLQIEGHRLDVVLFAKDSQCCDVQIQLLPCAKRVFDDHVVSCALDLKWRSGVV